MQQEIMAGKDDYSKFDAASYLRTRYHNPEEGRNPFSLRCFHDFVQKYKTQWDCSSAKFLEVGGGPNIIPLISVAPYVSEIVFSEYAAECRKSVQLWKAGSPEAHDWTPFMQYVLSNFEGNADPEATKTRENLVRSKVRVVPCNMLADEQSILEDEAAASTRYDIVSMNGCLEACVNSVNQYSECLGKLKHYLTPEGFFIGSAVYGASWWNVGGVEYHAFSMSEDEFLAAMQMAGYVLLEQKTTKIHHSLNNATGLTFYVAKLKPASQID